MPDVRSHSLACLSKSGFHRVAYREFAPQGTVPEHPVPVVCIHGLARNARDFDALAATLAAAGRRVVAVDVVRSEEHTSELQSLMRISYAVFCLKKKKP